MIKTYYILFFLFAVFITTFSINFFAAQYATVAAGPSIPDFFDFLGSERFIGVRNIATQVHLFYATLLIIPFFLYGVFFYPKKMVRFLTLDIILILIRMATVNMTHLGKVTQQPEINGYDFTFGGDLFFSGHVAYTFMLYLVFRDTPIKYPLMIFHIIVMLSTIVGRFHYTIDVIAAYAITYSIYKFTEPFFIKRNYQ